MVVNLARQELCIKPSCLCTLMKSGIPKKHMQAFWEILSYTEINDLYKALLPTNSGVLSLLEANKDLRPQEDAFFYYLRDFIRGLREDELSLFLWFVTRQDILPQQQIRVMFNRLEGIFRNCPGTVSLLRNYPAVFTRIQGYPVRPGKLRNRLCLRASRTITKIFRWQRRRQRKGYYSKDFTPWIRKRFHAQVPNYCERYLNLQRFALGAMMKYVCLRRKIHCNRTTSYCSMFFLVLWTSIYSYLVQKLIRMLNIVWQENRDMIVVSRSPCVLS